MQMNPEIVISKASMVYIIGDGGSAALSDHFACDLIKNCGIPAISLCSNAAVLTAIGNDYSFEEIFSRQLEVLFKEGDLLVVFTTSGNSENLIRACKSIRNVLVVSGNDGGNIKRYATYFFDLNSKDQQLSEDRMSEFCHEVMKSLMKERM